MPLLTDELERPSDSPYVETVMAGRTLAAGETIRPAECQWHLVFARHAGRLQAIVTGPLTTTGRVTFRPDAELLWIRFRLGVFMPHLPARAVRDRETELPGAAARSFWLHGSAWPAPTYDNADTFVARLARAGALAHDPVIAAALAGQPPALAARTVRQRFVAATGLTQTQIRQVERAKQAASRLRQGQSILDTVHAAGYFDQPHFTRALKRWVGYTPAQLVRQTQPACHFVQDAAVEPGYASDTLMVAR
jgi:AraC-like DNA-binding protein